MHFVAKKMLIKTQALSRLYFRQDKIEYLVESIRELEVDFYTCCQDDACPELISDLSGQIELFKEQLNCLRVA